MDFAQDIKVQLLLLGDREMMLKYEEFLLKDSLIVLNYDKDYVIVANICLVRLIIHSASNYTNKRYR